MRALSYLSRYLLTAIVSIIAVAASVAAIQLGSLPGAPDSLTLTLLVGIAVTASLAAVFAFRHATMLNTLAEASQRLAGYEADSNASGDTTTDDLTRLTASLQQINARLQSATVSSDHLDRVLDTLNDSIILTDNEGIVAHINQSAAKMLGFEPVQMIGSPIQEFIAEQQRKSFKLTDENRTYESTFVTRNGNETPVSYSCSRIDTEGFTAKGFIIAARDISERKMTERRIRYLAKIDALTKIPNRMQFQHLLQRMIARAQKNHHQIALLYLDVDHFKDINDTYGHAAGDTCLESFASRLSRILPENAINGRLAGDEFAVAIEWSGPHDALNAYLQSFSKHLLTDLGRVLIVQGHEIYMSPSIGIACYPQHGDNVIDLIRNADAALYHTKRSTDSKFEFFDAQMNAAAVERLMLKSKLRRSYEQDELLVHYQPKVDVKTGAIVGAEALVRWEMSERGLVLPSEFIPLAEETNLIVPIGEWVLNQVCADLSDWQHRIAGAGRVSVNLSLKQLAQPNFTSRIQHILKRHHVSPEALELEITETVLMRDPDHTIKILKQLDALGLRLSIDDFGTGYSSLSALQQFPIKTLKIDKSFIRDILVNKDGTTIVSAIIDLAHSMNMDVVAEGVESELQLSYLKVLNCDVVQGLLFGEPMIAKRYFDLLVTNSRGNTSYQKLFA